MSDQTFTIIYDTYCGWCYGAAPVFDALIETGADVQVLHRHLFQGPLAVHMRDGKGAMILQADARIAALTNQPFSARYRDNVVLSQDEVLFSRYTAEAAALVHHEGPEKEFALRRRLEKSRFVDGISASDRSVVVEALIAEGVAPDTADQVGTPALLARAEKIAAQARQLMAQVGSHGVPTLLRHRGGAIEQVDHTAYYGRPENIGAILN